MRAQATLSKKSTIAVVVSILLTGTPLGVVMNSLRSLIMVVLLGTPGVSWALDLSYTVSGYGGLSQPMAGFSTAPFMWIDWTGNVPGSQFTSYGFNPVLPVPGSTYDPSVGTGSLLLSSPFSLDAWSTLSVTTNVFTASFPSFDNVGFALLLEDSTLKAVLANVRPDNINHFADFGYIPGTVYAPPSPGVMTTVSVSGPEALTGVSLGGATYGQVLGPANCLGDCLTTVTSVVTPGAGSYQLLFGVYDLFGFSADRQYDESGLLRIDRPTALAVTAVNVPEPSSFLLLVAALGGLACWRRLKGV